eukprot:m.428135 g.428135  ORF g.428135 m.428135 type:complete len:464 (-) comp20231_c1_seq11:1338-2729(-)
MADSMLEEYASQFSEVCTRVGLAADATYFVHAFFEKFVRLEQAHSRALTELCESRTAKLARVFTTESTEVVPELQLAWSVFVEELRASAERRRAAAAAVKNGVVDGLATFLKTKYQQQQTFATEGRRLLKEMKTEYARFASAQQHYAQVSKENAEAVELLTKAYAPMSASQVQLALAPTIASASGSLSELPDCYVDAFAPETSSGSAGRSESTTTDPSRQGSATTPAPPMHSFLSAQQSPAIRELREQQKEEDAIYQEELDRIAKVHKACFVKGMPAVLATMHGVESERVEITKQALLAVNKVQMLSNGTTFPETVRAARAISAATVPTCVVDAPQLPAPQFMGAVFADKVLEPQRPRKTASQASLGQQPEDEQSAEAAPAAQRPKLRPAVRKSSAANIMAQPQPPLQGTKRASQTRLPHAAAQVSKENASGRVGSAVSSSGSRRSSHTAFAMQDSVPAPIVI